MSKVVYHTIITSPRLHSDLITAIILLKKFGENKFPGVGDAKVRFLENLPQKETGDILERKGIICLGIGKGRFDQQAMGAGEQSISDLVASALKISDNPSLEKILNYARREKREGRPVLGRPWRVFKE